MAALGRWCGRKMDAGSDDAGAFSWIRLRGRRGRRISFVTCYRVSQASAAGLEDNTAYVQQQTKLRLLGRRPDPREHALPALTEFIISRTAAGEEVVVAMDANESLRPCKGRLRSFLTDTGIVDVVGHRHAELPHTCIRSSARIDFIFVSPTLLPAVKKTGHIGIHDAIPSDHCGVWI